MIKAKSCKNPVAFLKALLYTSKIFDAGVAELVDALDSKSSSFGVSVQVRPPVPSIIHIV